MSFNLLIIKSGINFTKIKSNDSKIAPNPEHLFRLSPSPPTFPPLPRAFSFLFRNVAANKKQNEYEQEETLQTIPAPVGHAISSDIRECTEWHERLYGKWYRT